MRLKDLIINTPGGTGGTLYIFLRAGPITGFKDFRDRTLHPGISQGTSWDLTSYNGGHRFHQHIMLAQGKWPAQPNTVLSNEIQKSW